MACTQQQWADDSAYYTAGRKIQLIFPVRLFLVFLLLFCLIHFIRVINPGESWDYEINVTLSFEKRLKPFNSGCKSWDIIKETDELWLQKTFSVWPFNIEKSFESREYGLSLRKKWQEKGYLVLDNLVSEPIPISLREAMINNNDE